MQLKYELSVSLSSAKHNGDFPQGQGLRAEQALWVLIALQA